MSVWAFVKRYHPWFLLLVLLVVARAREPALNPPLLALSIAFPTKLDAIDFHTPVGLETVASFQQVPHDFFHFRLLLPARYSIKEIDRPMMDFNLYEVKSPVGTTTARLYVGNCPRFSFDPSRYVRRRLNADTILTEPKSWPGEILVEFENLKYQRSNQSPWTRIHAFDISKDSRQRQVITSALEQIQIVQREL